MRSSPSAGCVCFQLVSLSALFLPRTALSPTLMTDGGSCAAVNSPLPPAVPRLLWSKSKNLQYHRVIRRLLKPPVNQAFSSRKKKISSMRDVIERVESSRVERFLSLQKEILPFESSTTLLDCISVSNCKHI